MTTYEYKILIRPREEDLNRYGAEGYRIVSVTTDLRDGEMRVVIERGQEVYEAQADGNGKAGQTSKARAK